MFVCVCVCVCADTYKSSCVVLRRQVYEKLGPEGAAAFRDIVESTAPSTSLAEAKATIHVRTHTLEVFVWPASLPVLTSAWLSLVMVPHCFPMACLLRLPLRPSLPVCVFVFPCVCVFVCVFPYVCVCVRHCPCECFPRTPPHSPCRTVCVCWRRSGTVTPPRAGHIWTGRATRTRASHTHSLTSRTSTSASRHWRNN